MGEPAKPTPADRAATRELAAKIVEAVRNDEPMPLEWGALNTRASTEALLFQLAQEIVALTSDTYVSLQAEVERLRAVYSASLELRRIESTDIPGESIAELEANAPAAQRRSMVALTKWRTVVDAELRKVGAR